MISARSSRAPAPLKTMKPLPEIFVAASRSIRPSCVPISQCGFGLKSNFAGSPTTRSMRLSAARLADRHRVVVDVRDAQEDVGQLGFLRGQFLVDAA